MYRIAIVDELKDDLQRFQLYVHKNDSDRKFTVLAFEPNKVQEELIADLFNANLDAVITDYRLNEYNASITYDGVDLVNAIQNRRKKFPCFVLTSFDDDAVKDSEDVNIVYVKGIMNSGAESKVKATFLDRVEKQIQKYQSSVSEWTENLNVLEDIRKKRLLTPEEEDQFVELSHLLDRSIAGIESIPRSFYSNDTNSRLDDLIQKTDDLLRKLDKKK
jgi:DNA-binding NarL/FixJ family response regulator